ncbi:MAG: hypothetical protein JW395_1969 [Nitrospira sp.]|nr:hypothetical protein [Nitrospira sp.]
MLAIELDLSDDTENSEAVQCLRRDLLVTRLLCGENSMLRTDLNKALTFFEATKLLRNRGFLQPR